MWRACEFSKKARPRKCEQSWHHRAGCMLRPCKNFVPNYSLDSHPFLRLFRTGERHMAQKHLINVALCSSHNISSQKFGFFSSRQTGRSLTSAARRSVARNQTDACVTKKSDDFLQKNNEKLFCHFLGTVFVSEIFEIISKNKTQRKR